MRDYENGVLGMWRWIPEHTYEGNEYKTMARTTTYTPLERTWIYELVTEHGIREASRLAGVSASSILRWIAADRRAGKHIPALPEDKAIYTRPGLTIEEKRQAVAFAQLHGVSAAANQWKVSRVTIYHWLQLPTGALGALPGAAASTTPSTPTTTYGPLAPSHPSELDDGTATRPPIAGARAAAHAASYPISVQEAGRKGGAKRLESIGPDGFATMGRKGGVIAAQRNRERKQQLASLEHENERLAVENSRLDAENRRMRVVSQGLLAPNGTSATTPPTRRVEHGSGPASEGPEVMTARQAVRFLQISDSVLRRYVRMGKLMPCRLPGQPDIRFRRADLLALLEPANPPAAMAPREQLG